MVNKRKRDELNDSDADEVTPGKQILPVANLPHDFDKEPQDGMQYLFLVRRDARRLPHITRARNPYEVPEAKVAHMVAHLSTNVLPCEAWRIAFRTHFSNLRKNLTQATIHVDHDYPGSRRRIIPEKNDRDAWWKFLAGYPESVWRKKPSMSRRMRGFAHCVEIPVDAMALPDVLSRDGSCHFSVVCPVGVPGNVRQRNSFDPPPGATSMNAAPFAIDLSVPSEEVVEDHTGQLSPPEVTPNHLREIDHRTSIHLLMYFTHWINIHLQNPSDPLTTIPLGHGQWIFALLTKIEDQLSGDEMNILRNLARACLGLIQMYGEERAKNNAVSEGISSPPCVENTMYMLDAPCWIVYAAIAGYWGQRDLWADAEDTLASA